MRYDEMAHWAFVSGRTTILTGCGQEFDYTSSDMEYVSPTDVITCLRCLTDVCLHPDDRMFMVVTKVNKPCECGCHQEQHRFHVRWKPCCETPIDGGQPARVYEINTKEGMRPVIAKSKTEAEHVLREIGLLDGD